MLKQAHKYIYWLICTLFLLGMVWLCLRCGDPDPNAVRFRIEHESAPMELTLFDAGDGNAYVFLPSYADLDSLTIVTDGHTRASLGGVAISDGMNCGAFHLETPYDLTVDNGYRASLHFFRSANVAAMYINTDSGTMDYIHRDKSHTEPAAISMIADDGTLEYSDLNVTIKGRGNSTQRMAKRPYSLIFSSEVDLMGMGAAKNWILLANSYDKSNLNNKIVMDLAKQAGLFWSPECAYVDLYLNGEYRGLYLLCEKVEVDPSRLDIDTASGDFLCTVDISTRWDTMHNPFMTQAGRAVEITAPGELSDFVKNNIQNKVQQLEDIIMGSSDLTLADSFDLDSWIRRYLIDEVSGNIDSDLASSYFHYCDSVFYAGPVWDYDLAFGSIPRNAEPTAFIAKNGHRDPTLVTPYYEALYSNPSFYHRMVEIYTTEFLPILEQLIDSGISDLAGEIHCAAEMNLLRWRAMFTPIEERTFPTVYTPDEFLSYFRERVSFLNSAWIDGTEYCTLQYDPGNADGYCNISVEKGTVPDAAWLGSQDVVWINAQNGEPFDFSQPLESDVQLIRQAVETPAPAPSASLATRDYIAILSIAALLGLLACIAFIDIRQRNKERKLTNERTRA